MVVYCARQGGNRSENPISLYEIVQKAWNPGRRDYKSENNEVKRMLETKVRAWLTPLFLMVYCLCVTKGVQVILPDIHV